MPGLFLPTTHCILITVVLPVRNEVRFIARTLESILAQAYPAEQIEILVVDGRSDDGTRQIVTEFAQRDARIRLLDNPQRIVPTAMNKGIRAARGSIIVRVDGHAVIESDYIRRCVEGLVSIQADCIGGPIKTVGETRMARAIALAQSSPFGVGNAAFRYANTAQYVDTLAFGAYRREVFDRIGLFDEELVRNQDDELNFRLIQSGGKIWLDPQIRSTYFSRSTLRGLWKQYFEYGFWKVRVIQKHRRPASWRHLVPGAFVLALACLLVLGWLVGSPLFLFTVLLPYLFVSLSVSLWIAAHEGWRYAPLLPLAFATMHLAYGFGFLVGLARFGFSHHTRNFYRRDAEHAENPK